MAADAPMAADVGAGVPVAGGVGTPQGSDAALERAERRGLGFWAAMMIGWAVIAYALDGLLSESGSHPLGIFRLLVGLNVVNDALVLPAATFVGLLVSRLVPRWAVRAVQAGLIATAVLSVYAYPLVASYGKTLRAGPSRLPWNYAHNLGVVLAVVWGACALMAAVSWLRTRPSR